MRIILPLLLVALAALPAPQAWAHASDAGDAPSAVASPLQEQVDDNDDTRVEVQLVVLGIVVGVVFIGGTVIYVLRKRLGLVAPPPDDAAAGRHH